MDEVEQNYTVFVIIIITAKLKLTRNNSRL